MAKRVQVRLPDEAHAKLTMWAEKLGLSAAQLGGMAIQSGLDSIIRAVAPAESMTPNQWAVILKAMQDQGITLDNSSKVGSEELDDYVSSNRSTGPE